VKTRLIGWYILVSSKSSERWNGWKNEMNRIYGVAAVGWTDGRRDKEEQR